MVKRIISIVFFSILSCAAYAQVKVAILPAIDKTGEVKYSHKLMLTSSITTAISMTEGYEAYDRIDLSSIMDEQSFQRSGLVSDREIHKIGEMTGASYVLITEAAPYDASYIVAIAKIVNVESARIDNSANSIVNISDPNTLVMDCQKLTNQLLGVNSQSQTSRSSPSELKYIDLGLSVKWASCNIGASKPEEAGNYYSWGETRAKGDYSWGTYKWARGEKFTLTKYNWRSDNGIVDNKMNLESQDDVATVKYGVGYRIPTKEEWDELMKYCKWEWITRGSINGYKVTSYENGNSIFLPVVGCRGIRGELVNYNYEGYYWTSSLGREKYYGGECLPYSAAFNKDRIYINGFSRQSGHTVRPVKEY